MELVGDCGCIPERTVGRESPGIPYHVRGVVPMFWPQLWQHGFVAGSWCFAISCPPIVVLVKL